MANRDRIQSVILAIGGAIVALVMVFAAPAIAYPSGNNAVPQTARVEAELKPHFRELIGAGHHGYRRPSWSRWNNFYWRGSCGGYSQNGYSQNGYGQSGYSQNGYGQSGCAAPCDPRDPYCQQQPCDPNDPYCQQQPCVPNDPYCQQPVWASQDPYYFPTVSYGVVGGQQHVTVDCRQDRPGRLNEALNEVGDGGTVHVKGHGPACTATLQISRPVIIAGDPLPAFPIDADAGQAVLSAPPGAPCAVIDAGPRGGVEFRDVVIESNKGGRSACLQTFSSAVALTHVALRYSGESSAVYVQGGRLLVRDDSEILSTGYDAAVWSEDADIAISESHIDAGASAIDARPGLGQKINLSRVSLTSNPGNAGGSGPMGGIIGRRGRGGDCQFKLDDVDIHGFRTGMLFEGGLTVEASHIHIADSRMGVAVDGANVKLRRVSIFTTEYGVYRYSGRLEINAGVIESLTRPPVGWDGDPAPEIHDLSYYGEICRGLFGWTCRLRRDAPGWLSHHDLGRSRHWGWYGDN